VDSGSQDVNYVTTRWCNKDTGMYWANENVKETSRWTWKLRFRMQRYQWCL